MEFLDETIGIGLKKRAEKTPNNLAVITDEHRYTWLEIDLMSDYLAVQMMKKGIKKGDKVGIIGVNSPDWMFYFFAIAKIGAVSVLFNTRFKEKEIRHCIDITHLKHIFFSKNFENVSYENMLQNIIQSNYSEITASKMDKSYGEWRKICIDNKLRKDVFNMDIFADSSSAATIMFTSGTTGASKGVELRHYSVVNNSKAIQTTLNWNSSDVMCVAVPLFHSFGMTGCVLASMQCGCGMYLAKSTRTLDICEGIQKEKCTVMNGVPSMFLAMYRNGKRNAFDLSSIKSGLIAGSHIFPQDYFEILTVFPNMKLQPSYGQTETSPCVTLCHLDDTIETKSKCAGRPIDGVEVRIQKLDGSICGINVEGEIQVKGYNVMIGYVDNEKATKKAFTKDGWLKSGDLGYIKEDGNLVVTGRIKNLIIRGGENISPTEIENAIRRTVGDREVKVMGVPTKVLQEEIVACIEGEGDEELQNKIVNALKNEISDYKIPKYIAFMSEFPRNSTGKINERIIRDKMISEFTNIKRKNSKHNLL